MEVKGTALVSIPFFIRNNFGEKEYDRWLSTLSEETRKVYSGVIDHKYWYDVRLFLSEPTRKICDLFYNGDITGAWKCGQYSAEYSLRGIYKFFVKMGSPSFIISRAQKIITTYYRPCEMEVVSNTKGSATARITHFPEIDEILEARICGWIQQALIISGCLDVAVEQGRSLVHGDAYSEFTLTWQ